MKDQTNERKILYPKNLAIRELKQLFGIDYDKVSNKFYVWSDVSKTKVAPARILDYFERAGMDVSIFKDSKGWTYRISGGRGGEIFSMTSCFPNREVCTNGAVKLCFILRERQLRTGLPTTIEYDALKGNVLLGFDDRVNKYMIGNENYLHSCRVEGGYFIYKGKFGGLINKIKIQIENAIITSRPTKQEAEKGITSEQINGVIVTLINYVKDLDTLNLSKISFKL